MKTIEQTWSIILVNSSLTWYFKCKHIKIARNKMVIVLCNIISQFTISNEETIIHFNICFFFRHAHNVAFEKSDLFFICLLRPLSTKVVVDELEIQAAKVKHINKSVIYGILRFPSSHLNDRHIHIIYMYLSVIGTPGVSRKLNNLKDIMKQYVAFSVLS